MPRPKSPPTDIEIIEILGLPAGTANWLRDQAKDLDMNLSEYISFTFTNMFTTAKRTGSGKLVEQTGKLTVLSGQASESEPSIAAAPTKSGFKGVYPYAGKWLSAYTRSGKRIRIGVYATPEEAAHAYDDAMDARGEPRINFPAADDRAVMKALEHPPELDAVAAAHRAQAERNAALHRQIKNHNRVEPAPDDKITMLSTVTEEDYKRWAETPLPGDDQPIRDPNEVPDRTPIVDDPGPPRLIPVRRHRAAAVNPTASTTPTLVKPSDDPDPNHS